MRVYVKKDAPRYDYPADMEKIIAYLEEHGTLCVSASSVESFYRDFSDSRYSADWMAVDDDILEEFADWLADVDL